MRVHPDSLLRDNLTAAERRWFASPQPAVEREMPDGRGAAQAQAACLVRSAPASVFPVHGHLTGLTP